jgi:hypothetical protein
MREKFIEIQAIDSTIEVGDGRQLEVKGIGTVQLKIKVNNEIHHVKIEKTLYVPELSTNLISIGILSKKGLKVTFEKGKCVISKGKKTVAEGKMLNENNNL